MTAIELWLRLERLSEDERRELEVLLAFLTEELAEQRNHEAAADLARLLMLLRISGG